MKNKSFSQQYLNLSHLRLESRVKGLLPKVPTNQLKLQRDSNILIYIHLLCGFDSF